MYRPAGQQKNVVVDSPLPRHTVNNKGAAEVLPFADSGLNAQLL